MFGGWLDQPVKAGLAARDLALAMAGVHLLNGYDVLVPQFLGRVEFVEQLDALAGEVGVPFVEVALVSDATDAVRRFARRSLAPQTQQQRVAVALQERSGGTAELAQMYERLLRFEQTADDLGERATLGRPQALPGSCPQAADCWSQPPPCLGPR